MIRDLSLDVPSRDWQEPRPRAVWLTTITLACVKIVDAGQQSLGWRNQRPKAEALGHPATPEVTESAGPQCARGALAMDLCHDAVATTNRSRKDVPR